MSRVDAMLIPIKERDSVELQSFMETTHIGPKHEREFSGSQGPPGNPYWYQAKSSIDLSKP